MTIKEFGDLVIYAGAVAAAISAILALLWLIAGRPFMRHLQRELGATRQAATASRDVAAAVHAEVTPNHGSSLKDAVNRTEKTVDGLRKDNVLLREDNLQLRREVTAQVEDLRGETQQLRDALTDHAAHPSHHPEGP